MKLLSVLTHMTLLSGLLTGTAGAKHLRRQYEEYEDNYNEFNVEKLFSADDINLLEGAGLVFGLSPANVGSILSLVKVGLGVVDYVDRVFSKVFNNTSVDLSFSSRDRDMLAMFEVVSYRLDEIHLGVQGIQASLHRLAEGLPHLLRWEVMLNTLEEYTRPITIMHGHFQWYQRHRNKVENYTLLDFAHNVVSHQPNSVINLMASIHSMVAPDAPSLLRMQDAMKDVEPVTMHLINKRVTDRYLERYRSSLIKNGQSLPKGGDYSERMSLRPSVFDVLSTVLEKYDKCHLQHSDQQALLGLYSLVAVTQARAFAMVNFAYMLLRLHDVGTFNSELDFSRAYYSQYSKLLVTKARQVSLNASNSFSTCDPGKHVQGQTFVMFTELLQGHIQNEADLSWGGSCIGSCKAHDHTKAYHCSGPCEREQHKPCGGKLHSCRRYDSDADVCYSRDPFRRYDFVKYENGVRLGPSGSCADLGGTGKKVDSWWRFMAHCTNCFCLCDDPSSKTSHRHISLLPSVTDTKDNMVVTGLKVSRHLGVVILEVQQGRTMPQGMVDPSSLQWVKPIPLNISDPVYTPGLHYHTLTYEARSLDLDSLTAPPDHVVTGLKFRLLGGHLNLEMQVTPVHFPTGVLASDRSYWLSNDATPLRSPNPRTRHPLGYPDAPTRQPGPSQVDSRPETFVEFQSTDFRKDAAQMTVPYWDAQPVAPSPPSWLQGVSLTHRGQPHYGGFLAFELHLHNTSAHFATSPDNVTVV